MKDRLPDACRRRWKMILLISGLLILALTAGCGYQLPGGTDARPGGIHRLHISTVKNTTTYMDLTFSLTNSLVEQFSVSKVLRLTSNDIAEAVLRTEIVSVEISGAARDPDRTGSAARRVVVEVSASLWRSGSADEIWQGTFQSRRTYRVTEDQSTVEANLAKALGEIAEEIAEKIHDAMLQDF